MNLIILIKVMFLLFLKAVNGRLILRYINQVIPWQNASNHCKSLNGSLFSPTDDALDSLFRCSIYSNITSPIWTGRFSALSAWIEIQDCVKTIEYSRNVTYDEQQITQYDCQQYCKHDNGDTLFAQGLHGDCFCDVSSSDIDSFPSCKTTFPYRLYTVSKEYNAMMTSHKRDCTACANCFYTTCYGNCDSFGNRSFNATDCNTHRKVNCKNGLQNESLSWYDAKSLCHQHQTMLRDKKTLGTQIIDSWIGISRGYAFINSEDVKNPDPLECFVYSNKSLQNESCNNSRTFVCKIDIDNENEIQTDDCNVHVPSTDTTPQPTEYSTTETTDFMSTSKLSLQEINSTATAISTENQATTTSIATENKTTSTFYSTENQTSTSILTEHQTTLNLISNERQTISTSMSTGNYPVTTFQKPLSENRQSGQFPVVIVGSVIGVVFIILSIVAVLFMVRRKKILSNKNRKHDRAEKTEKPEKDKTKGSPLPVGSSNVSGSKSDVYCDPWQSFEESQTLTNAGKKLNRQSQNPMYELNSLQYDSYSVAGGLTKQSHTEKYENVNLDIYNHCNVGDSKMAASQQNVYDSAAGIYSHLNHGGIEDHNEDTYDHFHGSYQDYDQFDRTLRNTEESEYSIYQ